jgi:uncharacterized membrane protein YdjX (TVP38/TMEM64 family)
VQPPIKDLEDTGAEARRLLILAIAVACLVLVLHFTPLNQWIGELQALKEQIRAYGWKAYAAFMVGTIAAVALGVPRLALGALAGTLFGFVAGGLVALVSTMTGAWGAFLLARWGGRGWAESRLAGASATLRSVLATPTIAAIFIARQLPVPGILVNVMLGVLPTTQRNFLIGTGLGYLPSTAIVALAGSSLGKESLAQAMTQITVAMLGLGLLTMLLVGLHRRMTKRGSGGTVSPESASPKRAAGPTAA